MLYLPFALQGPMMSFSLSTHEREKRTQLIPTKSAIVGLLACCLGRYRDADNSDLAALSIMVRIDAQGTRLQDFHSVLDTLRANGEVNPDTFVSLRDYLQDAAFLVVVSGEDKLVLRLEAALRQPAFVPYLGRRTCLPARPLWVASPSREPVGSLTVPDLTGQGGRKQVWAEEQMVEPTTVPVFDQPLPGRRFGRRLIKSLTVDVPGREELACNFTA